MIGRLIFEIEGDAPGRIVARVGNLEVGRFDGYKNISSVMNTNGDMTEYPAPGLSEHSWRSKIHGIARQMR